MPLLQIDKRSSAAFAEEQHRRRTTWPVAWKANAISLNRSFKTLKHVAIADCHDEECDEPSIAATVLMLAGFVVENLLKGLIAKANKIPIVKGKPKFAHHKLNDLADDANILLSDDEAILLQRLTEFILWTGRYPAPQIADALRGHTNSSGGFGSLTGISIPKDFDDSASIISRLFGLLNA